MPGIHVRTIGQLGWDEQRKEPILTIPGSYWLCHKNMIYKLTLKFHKLGRNIEQFSYCKDLMRIIRRILKCSCKKGQRFCTTDILVTYNEGFWTRTDKLFAMMKFKDRANAIVAPNAIILTIKIGNKKQVSNSAVSQSSNKSRSRSNESNKFIMSLRARGTEDWEKPSPSYMEQPNKVVVSTNRKHSDKHPTLQENQEIANQSEIPDKCVSQKCGSLKTVYENTTIVSGNDILENCSNQLESIPIAEKVSQATNSKGRAISPDAELTPVVETLMETGASEVKNEPSSSFENEKTEESQVDSDCLPNQYLIERDIENAKKMKKNESDVKKLHSLDITELVMKGLMFTIRQDKDSVTVVKQKTKMEMDEVLENSEKVETKEGDPCLMNSSLLKLESLITKIDAPTGKRDQMQILDSTMDESFNGVESDLLLDFKEDAVENIGNESVSRDDHGSRTGENFFCSISDNVEDGQVRCAVISDEVVKSQDLPSTLFPLLNVTCIGTSQVDRESSEVPAMIETNGNENIGACSESSGVERNAFQGESSLVSLDVNNSVSKSPNEKQKKVFNRNVCQQGTYPEPSVFEPGKVQVDMYKLVRDITKGVKVVVKRLCTKKLKL